MAGTKQHPSSIPFSSDQACVVYLFKKRWPGGFKCAFCGAVQQEMAPAYTVVCRFCRKQTSITAHTLMHGSKKNLVAWMRAVWQFCSQYEGISARELQRLMELSSYQTAWSWLRKLRRGAALAESAPCRDIVLFELRALPLLTSSRATTPDICMALELSHLSQARVRFTVLDSISSSSVTTAVNRLVEENATLLMQNHHWLTHDCLIHPDMRGYPTSEQVDRGRLLLQQTVCRLNSLYRKAINPCYLQGYLDEFSFRHNTASWSDHLTVLDHLLTGLMSTVEEPPRTKQAISEGEIS